RDFHVTGVQTCALPILLGLALPGVDRGRLDVLHRGDELYVKVDSHTRSVLLPAALRRCHVTRAALDDGRLEVTFTAEEQHEQPRSEERRVGNEWSALRR